MLAQELTLGIMGGGEGGPPNLSWRETANKISIKFAGYCDPGPLRPPFVKVPDSVMDSAKRRAEYWQGLCDRTRPLVQEQVPA